MTFCRAQIARLLKLSLISVSFQALSAPSLLILQEYEDGVTPEAVVVKDLDKFDMVFQAHEYETGIGDS